MCGCGGKPIDVCRGRRLAISIRHNSTDHRRGDDVESDSNMKVCIFGAGAIGGFIGAKLASTGHDVSAVARGATATALREHGFRVRSAGRMDRFDVRVAEDPAALGVQDVVVVSVKAPSLPAVAERLAPLLGEHTVVLVAMNGVPWWFFNGFGGEHAGMQLESVDPGGAIGRSIPAKAVLGCVVHIACSTPEPGLVQHNFGNTLIVGEPSGGVSARAQALSTALAEAGFDATASPLIQKDVWYKLWGNMTTNPMSALTGATADLLLDDPQVLRFCMLVMAEAAAIGARVGCSIEQTGEDRMRITRTLGALKTSMLQDVEARRPVELDAIVTAVHEIGRNIGEPTPFTDALLGLARVQAQVLGLYPKAID
ncbi:MAG: panE [Rhizobacter sp.]|nr:panE [Rhizobacter sp.]